MDCEFSHSAIERIITLHFGTTKGVTAYEQTKEMIKQERKRLKLTDDFPDEDLQ